jgi:hypothetical protein
LRRELLSHGCNPTQPRTDESITVAKKVAGTLRVPFSAHGVCGLLWKTRHLLIRRSQVATLTAWKAYPLNDPRQKGTTKQALIDTPVRDRQ